jgi:phosphohistidine phosphatase
VFDWNLKLFLSVKKQGRLNVKKLILVRHSDAEHSSFDTPDFDRRLTPQGQKRAKLQANLLLNKNLIPNLIITSNAIRAKETVALLLTILNPDCQIQLVPFLYDDFTTTDFFNLISSIDENKTVVMVVGHNPTISVMASRLDFKSQLSFKPCSMAIFNTTKEWNLLEVGDAKLSDFMH